MKKYFLVVIILFLIIFSCSHKEDDVFDEKLKGILKTYIKENPLDLRIYSLNKEKYSYPSYHLYFNKNNNDTIISIIQLPHLSNFNIDADKKLDTLDRELSFSKIDHKGLLILDEKYPIIVFDIYNISNNLINKDKLIKIIPDSLKLQNENYHIESSRQDYKLNKGIFQKI